MKKNKSAKEIKAGDIVKHKLTKEKLLVLSAAGLAFSSSPEQIRVRRKNYDIISVGENEIIKTQNK